SERCVGDTPVGDHHQHAPRPNPGPRHLKGRPGEGDRGDRQRRGSRHPRHRRGHGPRRVGDAGHDPPGPARLAAPDGARGELHRAADQRGGRARPDGAVGKQPFGAVLAAALRAAWKVPGLDLAIPQIQGMVIEARLRGAGQFGGMPRGPHYRITTGPREDNDQNDFRSDSIELVFDATRPEYLDFLDEVLRVGRGFHQAGYVSLRPSLRSSALLSMHNVEGARAMSIEIASAKHLDGNAAWMAYVHQAALRYGGRPHWGQYNKLDALDVEMLYGDKLSEWREALLT